MRALVIVALSGAVATNAFAAPPPASVQQNGWLIYQDLHVSQTAPCVEQPILLRGSHTTFALNGSCTYVRIEGEHNDITIQIGAAATIEITGEHNDVTWQQMVPGPPPHLLDDASSNTFHRAE